MNKDSFNFWFNDIDTTDPVFISLIPDEAAWSMANAMKVRSCMPIGTPMRAKEIAEKLEIPIQRATAMLYRLMTSELVKREEVQVGTIPRPNTWTCGASDPKSCPAFPKPRVCKDCYQQVKTTVDKPIMVAYFTRIA